MQKAAKRYMLDTNTTKRLEIQKPKEKPKDGHRNMSTSLSPYEFSLWCNPEKSVTDPKLDKKMVSVPKTRDPNSSFTSGFLQQQHSDSTVYMPVHHAFGPSIWSPNFPGAVNGGSRFGAASFASYSPLKEPSGIGRGTSVFNRNRLRYRSFSDNDHHLLEQNGRGGFGMNALRYKTELCRPFQEYGKCKYGEKCQFAHGFHELRSLSRHPKYKTEPCRTFHSIGFCPYGPRCHFIHDLPFGGPLGNRRAFSGRGRDFQVFSWEQRHKLSHNFLGSPQDKRQPPMLLDSPIWRLPPPLSCFSLSATSTPSDTPTTSASGEATPATLLYGTAGAEKLLPPGTSFANNAFDFGLELSTLIAPVGSHTRSFDGAATPYHDNQQQQDPAPFLQSQVQPSGPPSSTAAAATASTAAAAAAAAAATPPEPPFTFQQLHRQSNSVFEPASPPLLLSDGDRYHSGSRSSGTINGCEDPSFDPCRRLPIFTRLSISDN
ncbi:mRNA decay activator protein ZFP36L2-like [Thomomys bottae]